MPVYTTSRVNFSKQTSNKRYGLYAHQLSNRILITPCENSHICCYYYLYIFNVEISKLHPWTRSSGIAQKLDVTSLVTAGVIDCQNSGPLQRGVSLMQASDLAPPPAPPRVTGGAPVTSRGLAAVTPCSRERHAPARIRCVITRP